jgi:hypothetical protein
MKRARLENIGAILASEADASDELRLAPGASVWIGRSSLKCLRDQNKCSRNQLQVIFDDHVSALKVCAVQGKNPTFVRSADRLDWSKVGKASLLHEGDVLRFPQDVNVSVKILGRKVNYGKKPLSAQKECVYGKLCKLLSDERHMRKFSHSEQQKDDQ